MSRKSALQAINSGFSYSTPSPRPSSPLTGEMPSTHNPYVLQEEIIPGKTPYTRRHHGKSSGLGLESAGGGSKDGRSGGKNGTGGGSQGQTDDDSESSSGQDEEEADDDDDGEAEEPAADGPAYVDGNDTAIVVPLTGQSAITLKVNGITGNGDHLAGPVTRKRSFSMAMKYEGGGHTTFINGGEETGIQTDEDEPDYPRKRVATELSNMNGLLTYPGPPSVVTDNTNVEDDDEDEFEDEDEDDDNDAIITDDEFDEEDMENIEEAAIIQELQTPTKPNPALYEYGLENTDLMTAEELEDLDNEVFNVQWHNPDLFADINLNTDFDPFPDPFADVELGGGLFPENVSAASTPFATPTTTRHGSFSTAPPSGPGSPKYTFSDISIGNNLNSESEDDAVDLNPFFERDDPILDHIVSTQGKGTWADDTDYEHGLWKHFFSDYDTYGSSSDEFEAGSEDGSGEDEEEGDCKTDDGETTDEEENLPMPTPRSKSMLRRASITSTCSTRPQVVHVDDSSPTGPTLGSWVADPTRTICVIDGAKRTFLVPGGTESYQLGDTSDSNTLSQLMIMEESESEHSSGQMGYNPTLSGLTGGDGLFLNGSDILGPPEAFYPIDLEDLLGLDGISGGLVLDDDDVDEFEQGLQITDFLDISTDDGNDDDSGNDDDDDDDDDDNDECVPTADSSEAMLALWDHVAVTSFRKRQIQHTQGYHASNATAPSTGKDRKLSQTITPARKKIKQRYLVNGTGAGLKKRVPSRRTGVHLGAGSQ